MQEPDEQAVQQATRRFRYDALELCQASRTEVSWCAAQHLLDQCWNAENDSEVKSYATAIVYVCPDCGVDLHPGWEGTSLRVARFPAVQSERTRRRRLQRKQRRLLLSRQKQAKDTNKDKLASAKLKESDSLVVERMILREDSDLVFDRHHLILSCGRCHSKTPLKGLKRESPPTKQSIQRKQLAQGRTMGVKQVDKKPVEDTIDDSMNSPSDFLQLPPPSKPSASTSGKSTAKVPPLFLQNSKKSKKNKRGGENKKGQLLSFLSSLND